MTTKRFLFPLPPCPICESSSPESQERLRETARLGLARFLTIARKARVDITMEQQRDIYDALLTWDPGGVPAEGDWIVHEWADRAVHWAIIGLGVDPRLIKVKASMPPWNANFYDPRSWNWRAEQRIADQLEPLLRDVDEGQ